MLIQGKNSRNYVGWVISSIAGLLLVFLPYYTVSDAMSNTLFFNCSKNVFGLPKCNVLSILK